MTSVIQPNLKKTLKPDFSAAKRLLNFSPTEACFPNLKSDVNAILRYHPHFWGMPDFLGFLHHDNIICLTGQPEGRLPSVLSLDRRMMLMSTYEEFMILLTLGLLIVSILNLKNK